MNISVEELKQTALAAHLTPRDAEQLLEACNRVMRQIDGLQTIDVRDISPISHPGMPGGNYLAAGIEHNELGHPTASGELHARMNEKRFHKLNPLKNRRDLFVIEGDPDAPIGLVSWGSVAGVAREALRLAQAEGIHAKLLVPKLLYPVAEPVFQDFFA